MAILCLPNQPIDFCSRANLCYDEEFCVRVQPSDVNQVQVRLTQKTGAELVVNGDFATDTVWTKGTGWTITGGKAVATAATGNLQQDNILTVGKYYWLSFDLSEWSSGLLITPIGNTNINGTWSGVFLATSIHLIFDPSTNFTGKLDNVSVIELSMFGWRLINCDTGVTIVDNSTGASLGNIDYLETDISAAGIFQGSQNYGVANITFDWDNEFYDDLNPPSCFCICLVEESDQIGCTLQSQPICIADSHPGTKLLTAKQDQFENFTVGNGLVLNFVQFPNFQLTFRLEARLHSMKPDSDYSNYQFSTFGRKTTSFESLEVWTLTTEELPYPQHRALIAMAGMDQFYIDGVQHFLHGDLQEADWPKGTDHAAFEMEVVETGVGLKNSNC